MQNYSNSIQLRKIIKNAQLSAIALDANIDLDALGATIGIAALLKYWKKNYVIVSAEPIPPIYLEYLDIDKVCITSSFDDARISPDLIIVPDIGNLSQLGNLFDNSKAHFSSTKMVHIDHHAETSIVADFKLLDKFAAATCEQMVLLFQDLRFKPNPTEATLLLSGIMSDTRSLSTPNVTLRTMKAVSWLIGKLADPVSASRLARGHSFTQIKLWGLSLAKLESICNGVIGLTIVTNEMIRLSGNENANTSGLINLIDDTLEFRACALIKETPSGDIKVSFRSPRAIEVVKIAKKYGGGGHLYAAACNLGHISIEEAKSIIENEFAKLIEETN